MTETSPTVLITGASRGLGYALGVELAQQNHHVIALARTVGGLEELADAIAAEGGDSTLVPLDITDAGGLQRMCHAIHERWGKLDLWVHAAIHATPMAQTDSIAEKDFQRAMAINVAATQRLIRMVSPLLKAAPDGRAVHLNDDKAGKPFFGSYGASKAAQTALFASWAEETRRIGPTVLSLTPRPMATGLRARFFPGEPRAPLADPKDEAARLVPQILAPALSA